MTILPLFLAVLLAARGGATTLDAPAVLHAWDERRAAAWAAADPAALHRLYVPGSPAGRADVAMLLAWRHRGLHVDGLRMQLLAVRVERRSSGRVVLRVVDRVVGAVAVGAGV